MQEHPRVTSSAPPDPACNLWTQVLHAVVDRVPSSPRNGSPRRLATAETRQNFEVFPQAPRCTASLAVPMQDCGCPDQQAKVT